MKSKISFFNKTIFWKNVTLYWPMWGLYTLLLFIIQPFLMWVNLYNSQYYEHYTDTDRLSDIISCLDMEPYILLIAAASVIMGMALFSYLYNSKSANMIHALPVDKTQLFGTNVLSGLAFLILPQILTFVISMLVCVSYGMPHVECLAIWLLLCMATAFIAFSVVVFCAMFTGLLIALPIYVFILNFLSYWGFLLVMSVVSTYGYGVNDLGSKAEYFVKFFNPLVYFFENVSIDQKYEIVGTQRVCVGVDVSGTGAVVVYLVIALVLYAAAFVTYRKRQIETAGDLLTVKWVKPIFRWGVGVTTGFFGSMLVREIAQSMGFSFGLPAYLVTMLFLGMIGYFAADMFVRKTFRVFKKRNWMGCGIFSVVLLIGFFGLYGLSGMYERYVPKQEDVESARIGMGYDMLFEGEDAQVVLDIHEEIVEYIELCEKSEKEYNYILNEWVSIRYTLKNGDSVYRSYSLPYDYEQIEAIVEKIILLEEDADNFLSNQICKRYDEVTDFGTGWFGAQFMTEGVSEEDLENYEDYSYENVAFTPEQVKQLYAAMLADAKAGTLIPYNSYSSWRYENGGRKYSEVSMVLGFRDPDVNYKTSINMSENSYELVAPDSENVEVYEGYSEYYFQIGPDCENIVNKLIEFGVFESVEDIYWGEK